MLHINNLKGMWYVKSWSYIVDCFHTYCIFLQGPPILFLFIHWKDRITNHNLSHNIQLHQWYANHYNKKRYKLLTPIGMWHLYSLLFKIIKIMVYFLKKKRASYICLGKWHKTHCDTSLFLLIGTCMYINCKYI